MQSGCYHLLIRLRRPADIQIGRRGRFRFPAGWYVYTGSARGGLAARIKRHLSDQKRMHWHVDYLLASAEARVADVVQFPDGTRSECDLNQAVGRLPGARVPVPGFGSSDCRSGCPAHLYYFRKRPDGM